MIRVSILSQEFGRLCTCDLPPQLAYRIPPTFTPIMFRAILRTGVPPVKRVFQTPFLSLLRFPLTYNCLLPVRRSTASGPSRTTVMFRFSPSAMVRSADTTSSVPRDRFFEGPTRASSSKGVPEFFLQQGLVNTWLIPGCVTFAFCVDLPLTVLSVGDHIRIPPHLSLVILF